MRKKCLDMVYELAKKNKKVIFIGSDLGAGVLSNLQKELPNQFFLRFFSTFLGDFATETVDKSSTTYQQNLRCL